VLGLVEFGFDHGVAIGDEGGSGRADVDAVNENAATVDVLLFMSVCAEIWQGKSVGHTRVVAVTESAEVSTAAMVAILMETILEVSGLMIWVIRRNRGVD
jgi:hypothetical protein